MAGFALRHTFHGTNRQKIDTQSEAPCPYHSLRSGMTAKNWPKTEGTLKTTDSRLARMARNRELDRGGPTRNGHSRDGYPGNVNSRDQRTARQQPSQGRARTTRQDVTARKSLTGGGHTEEHARAGMVHSSKAIKSNTQQDPEGQCHLPFHPISQSFRVEPGSMLALIRFLVTHHLKQCISTTNPPLVSQMLTVH